MRWKCFVFFLLSDQSQTAFFTTGDHSSTSYFELYRWLYKSFTVDHSPSCGMSDVQSLLILQKIKFLHVSMMSAPQGCFQRYWRWVDTFHWCPLSDHEWTKMRQLSTWKRLKVSSSGSALGKRKVNFILTAEPLKIYFSWTCKFIFAQYKDCGCVPLSLTLKFHWKWISSRPFKGTNGHICTIFYISVVYQVEKI